jgi:mitogen-activated protein kinase kinase kinase MLK4
MKDLKYLKGVKLTSKIGEGQFGQVYKGTWQSQDVALKHIKDPTAQVKMQEEAVLLSALNHINIVRYYGLASLSDGLWLVLEFVSDGSLDKLLVDFPEKFEQHDLLQM